MGNLVQGKAEEPEKQEEETKDLEAVMYEQDYFAPVAIIAGCEGFLHAIKAALRNYNVKVKVIGELGMLIAYPGEIPLGTVVCFVLDRHLDSFSIHVKPSLHLCGIWTASEKDAIFAARGAAEEELARLCQNGHISQHNNEC